MSSTRPTLRPYQILSIERIRDQIRSGKRRIVLVMPTGGGKTIVAADIIHAAMQRGTRSLFLAHRRELIDQTEEKLSSYDVAAGVIMGKDDRRDDFLPTQIASVATIVNRLQLLHGFSLVVVDECHHATSPTYRKVIDALASENPNAVILGLTATPWRSDRIGLADIYEASVLAATPTELMQIGAIVHYDAFAYDAPDLHEVKIVAGEFNTKQLALACNTKVLVGSAVREYATHAAGRRAIVFPVNVAHSRAVVDEFKKTGFTAAHVDCKTPVVERRQIMADFKGGKLLILSSVGVLTEGFDAPATEVVILLRPTKSLTLYIQMMGRGLRPSPGTGKIRALVHDHAGNILRHGFIEDERDYSLTATPDRVRALHTCPECFHIFSKLTGGRCPNCKALIAVPEQRSDEERKNSTHLVVEGHRISREQIEKLRGRREELQLERSLTDMQLAKVANATRSEKIAEFLRLRQVAEVKGFKPGFAAHQFRQVFAHWPRFTDEELAAEKPAEKPFLPLSATRVRHAPVRNGVSTRLPDDSF